MAKYNLDPQYKILTHFKLPLWKWPAVPLQAGMRLWPVLSDDKVQVTTERIPGPDGNKIKVYVMRPRGLNGSVPCFFYIHGGGFYFPSAPYHYSFAKEYAWRAGCVVVYPDYRLAPKHPYPAAAEDCWAAYRWTVENAAKLGIDTSRIAVGGDSAGGDLAAVMTLMARDRNAAAKPMFQLLIYPVTDRRMGTASAKAYRDVPVWNAALSEKMWAYYLPELPTEHIEYASPMEAKSFEGLPEAYVEVAEFDSLRDEGKAYADALEQAGVKVTRYETHGTPHGFEFISGAPMTKATVRHRAEILKEAFQK